MKCILSFLFCPIQCKIFSANSLAWNLRKNKCFENIIFTVKVNNELVKELVTFLSFQLGSIILKGLPLFKAQGEVGPFFPVKKPSGFWVFVDMFFLARPKRLTLWQNLSSSAARSLPGSPPSKLLCDQLNRPAQADVPSVTSHPQYFGYYGSNAGHPTWSNLNNVWLGRAEAYNGLFKFPWLSVVFSWMHLPVFLCVCMGRDRIRKDTLCRRRKRFQSAPGANFLLCLSKPSLHPFPFGLKLIFSWM